MQNDQIHNAIKSALATASAWAEKVGVYCTVECETHTGGRLFTWRKSQPISGIGQPYRQIATVLPPDYFQRCHGCGWCFAPYSIDGYKVEICKDCARGSLRIAENMQPDWMKYAESPPL